MDCRKIFRKIGVFSSKTRRAIGQNPKAIERWLNIEYPMIQKLAKREKATIHWGDEMGLRSDHNVGRTYGKKVLRACS